MTEQFKDRALRYAAATHKGLVRDGNEDAVLATDTILRGDHVVRSGRVSLERPSVFMIADGMGGHVRGEVASNHALEYLKINIDQFPFMDWEDRIIGANDDIFGLMTQRLELVGMGTTLVGAEISCARTVLFNVGDSRAYRLLDDVLVRISVDDVPQTSTRARTHEITQALGGRLAHRRIFPHVSQQAPLKAGEQLLLCSDGLSDMVSERAIHGILLAEAEPESAVRLLLQAALDAGGVDNISIVAVRLG